MCSWIYLCVALTIWNATSKQIIHSTYHSDYNHSICRISDSFLETESCVIYLWLPHEWYKGYTQYLLLINIHAFFIPSTIASSFSGMHWPHRYMYLSITCHLVWSYIMSFGPYFLVEWLFLSFFTDHSLMRELVNRELSFSPFGPAEAFD